ncbi:hypothetical protein AYI69_g6449 [Smittium culicis]|uniref:Zinc finger PHD-type domain-containing protein n=1 Tax=Smittium culicis TaxID=133412 RepID=A0A1R1XYY2_9FUNG|nr:hypothetical protein AYI69_g6449 [Smittium culicis]
MKPPSNNKYNTLFNNSYNSKHSKKSNLSKNLSLSNLLSRRRRRASFGRRRSKTNSVFGRYYKNSSISAKKFSSASNQNPFPFKVINPDQIPFNSVTVEISNQGYINYPLQIENPAVIPAPKTPSKNILNINKMNNNVWDYQYSSSLSISEDDEPIISPEYMLQLKMQLELDNKSKSQKSKSKKIALSQQKNPQKSRNIFCQLCGNFANLSSSINCSECNDPFHENCVGVSHEMLGEYGLFSCQTCVLQYPRRFRSPGTFLMDGKKISNVPISKSRNVKKPAQTFISNNKSQKPPKKSSKFSKKNQSKSKRITPGSWVSETIFENEQEILLNNQKSIEESDVDIDLCPVCDQDCTCNSIPQTKILTNDSSNPNIPESPIIIDEHSLEFIKHASSKVPKVETLVVDLENLEVSKSNFSPLNLLGSNSLSTSSNLINNDISTNLNTFENVSCDSFISTNSNNDSCIPSNKLSENISTSSNPLAEQIEVIQSPVENYYEAHLFGTDKFIPNNESNHELPKLSTCENGLESPAISYNSNLHSEQLHSYEIKPDISNSQNKLINSDIFDYENSKSHYTSFTSSPGNSLTTEFKSNMLLSNENSLNSKPDFLEEKDLNSTLPVLNKSEGLQHSMLDSTASKKPMAPYNSVSPKSLNKFSDSLSSDIEISIDDDFEEITFSSRPIDYYSTSFDKFSFITKNHKQAKKPTKRRGRPKKNSPKSAVEPNASKNTLFSNLKVGFSDSSSSEKMKSSRTSIRPRKPNKPKNISKNNTSSLPLQKESSNININSRLNTAENKINEKISLPEEDEDEIINITDISTDSEYTGFEISTFLQSKSDPKTEDNVDINVDFSSISSNFEDDSDIKNEEEIYLVRDEIFGFTSEESELDKTRTRLNKKNRIKKRKKSKNIKSKKFTIADKNLSQLNAFSDSDLNDEEDNKISNNSQSSKVKDEVFFMAVRHHDFGYEISGYSNSEEDVSTLETGSDNPDEIMFSENEDSDNLSESDALNSENSNSYEDVSEDEVLTFRKPNSNDNLQKYDQGCDDSDREDALLQMHLEQLRAVQDVCYTQDGISNFDDSESLSNFQFDDSESSSGENDGFSSDFNRSITFENQAHLSPIMEDSTNSKKENNTPQFTHSSPILHSKKMYFDSFVKKSPIFKCNSDPEFFNYPSSSESNYESLSDYSDERFDVHEIDSINSDDLSDMSMSYKKGLGIAANIALWDDMSMDDASLALGLAMSLEKNNPTSKISIVESSSNKPLITPATNETGEQDDPIDGMVSVNLASNEKTMIPKAWSLPIDSNKNNQCLDLAKKANGFFPDQNDAVDHECILDKLHDKKIPKWVSDLMESGTHDFTDKDLDSELQKYFIGGAGEQNPVDLSEKPDLFFESYEEFDISGPKIIQNDQVLSAKNQITTSPKSKSAELYDYRTAFNKNGYDMSMNSSDSHLANSSEMNSIFNEDISHRFDEDSINVYTHPILNLSANLKNEHKLLQYSGMSKDPSVLKDSHIYKNSTKIDEFSNQETFSIEPNSGSSVNDIGSSMTLPAHHNGFNSVILNSNETRKNDWHTSMGNFIDSNSPSFSKEASSPKNPKTYNYSLSNTINTFLDFGNDEIVTNSEVAKYPKKIDPDFEMANSEFKTIDEINQQNVATTPLELKNSDISRSDLQADSELGLSRFDKIPVNVFRRSRYLAASNKNANINLNETIGLSLLVSGDSNRSITLNSIPTRSVDNRKNSIISLVHPKKIERPEELKKTGPLFNLYNKNLLGSAAKKRKILETIFLTPDSTSTQKSSNLEDENCKASTKSKKPLLTTTSASVQGLFRNKRLKSSDFKDYSSSSKSSSMSKSKSYGQLKQKISYDVSVPSIRNEMNKSSHIHNNNPSNDLISPWKDTFGDQKSFDFGFNIDNVLGLNFDEPEFEFFLGNDKIVDETITPPNSPFEDY